RSGQRLDFAQMEPASSVSSDRSLFRVPLVGSLAMQLRLSDLAGVAVGLGKFDSSEVRDLLTLVEALRTLPVNDPAPDWVLAAPLPVRRLAPRRSSARPGDRRRRLVRRLPSAPRPDPRRVPRRPPIRNLPPSPSGRGLG